MIIPGSVFLIGICGFSYLILALQVSSGFPPFYAKGKMEELKLVLLPFILAIMVILVAAVFVPYLFVLFGLVSAWCGVRVRRMVREQANGPLPWLLNPLTIGLMSHWPMLLFDAWTVGLAALMGLIMFM
jgi:hypothetical protein